MFLDDELLKMCKDADLDTSEGIQQLNKDLCAKCESYYKSKLHPNIKKSELKVILDRTFKLWDSFVRMAENNEDPIINSVSRIFKKHSFKYQLLQNDEINRIYSSL
jgi:hypothetical protein